MAIGAAASGRREAARHHGKRPARGDGRPSSAFRLECRSETFATTPLPRRMRTRVPMNSPKNFAPILVPDLRPRHQVNFACFIKTAFVAWLNSTFVRPLQFTCLGPPAKAAG